MSHSGDHDEQCRRDSPWFSLGICGDTRRGRRTTRLHRRATRDGERRAARAAPCPRDFSGEDSPWSRASPSLSTRVRLWGPREKAVGVDLVSSEHPGSVQREGREQPACVVQGSGSSRPPPAASAGCSKSTRVASGVLSTGGSSACLLAPPPPVAPWLPWRHQKAQHQRPVGTLSVMVKFTYSSDQYFIRWCW